jgi:hypothetical protein
VPGSLESSRKAKTPQAQRTTNRTACRESLFDRAADIRESRPQGRGGRPLPPFAPARGTRYRSVTDQSAPTLAIMLNPVRPPRKPIVRVLLAGLLNIALLGSASELSVVVQDATGRSGLGNLAAWILAAPFVVWLAPKVSYRRRDALFGPWVFLIVAWRITYLPYRDWPPRDDEMAQALYIREAEFGADWKPEYTGLWRLPKSSDVQMVTSGAA